MDFHDFPRILGNLGVETDHPPKMCAGLDISTLRRDPCKVTFGAFALICSLWIELIAAVSYTPGTVATPYPQWGWLCRGLLGVWCMAACCQGC